MEKVYRVPMPPPNELLKLPARVHWGMNLCSARRSLSAVRYAASVPPLTGVSL